MTIETIRFATIRFATIRALRHYDTCFRETQTLLDYSKGGMAKDLLDYSKGRAHPTEYNSSKNFQMFLRIVGRRPYRNAVYRSERSERIVYK